VSPSLRPAFEHWLSSVRVLLDDVGHSVDQLSARLTADANAAERRETRCNDEIMRPALSSDLVLNDAQSNVRNAIHIMLERSYVGSFFVSKHYIEECLGLQSLVESAKGAIGDAFGEEARDALRSEIVLRQPSGAALSYSNCGALVLGTDRVGLLLTTTPISGFSVVGLLQFAASFSGESLLLSPSRGPEVTASDPAPLAEFAGLLQRALSAEEFPKRFSLGSIPVPGAAGSQQGTDLITRDGGITVVTAGAGLGPERHAIPDLSAKIANYDVCVELDVGHIRAILADRVAAFGRELGGDYRPASASLGGDLRFDVASQTIGATANVSVTQQGGTNPCEYELPCTFSVSLAIRPVRVSANSFEMETTVESASDIAVGFRWRQDWSPCELVVPQELVNGFLDVAVGLAQQFMGRLDGEQLAGAELSFPQVSFLDLRIESGGALILARLPPC
jgi:hypothetical protein